MSSFATIRDHVMERLNSELTIPSARRDWTAIANFSKFSPPSASGGSVADKIWVRPAIVDLPEVVPPIAGATHPGPMGIGPTSSSYRKFLIVGQHFAPKGRGFAELAAQVDVFNGIFHRQSFGTNPTVVCQDADEPTNVGVENNLEEWYQITAIIPAYVQDPN